jgi:hypothetical protein
MAGCAQAQRAVASSHGGGLPLPVEANLTMVISQMENRLTQLENRLTQLMCDQQRVLKTVLCIAEFMQQSSMADAEDKSAPAALSAAPGATVQGSSQLPTIAAMQLQMQ